MVLGLGSKRKGQPVKVEFVIFIQEIKPWKPVQSGKTPVVIQWQRGDKRTGKTKIVVPDEDGKIVFSESFKLPAKLVREEGKGKNAGVVKFSKKTVIFSLLEATTDRQLARCVVDLGEYGDAETAVQANAPLTTGKKVVTGGSPTLSFKIGLSAKKEEPRTSFSARVSFGSKAAAAAAAASKAPAVSAKAPVEPALDEATRKSIVAALMSDEEDDNDSIASFTDDEDEGSPASTPRSDPKTSGSTSKTAVSESVAKPPPVLFHPSPARPDSSKTSGAPSHAPPPRPEAPKVSAPPSHPPPPRPDAPKVSSPPSHPPPPKPDIPKVSAPPSHPPPARPETPKVSPPSAAPQSTRSDVSKVPAPTSIPLPGKIDTAKSSQSVQPKRDSGEATRIPASPAETRADASRSTGLFTSGTRSPTSSIESSNHGSKVPKSSLSASESGSHTSKTTKNSKLSAEEQEEESRAALFSSEPDHRSSKGTKIAANAVEPPRAALGLFSSGTTNVAGRGGRSSPTPGERSRSPQVSKESSRGSSPSDSKAAIEAAGSDIAKSPRTDTHAEKDRLQKSSIPLPPISAKAAAAAAATAYAAKRTYRSRGNSFDFTFDSGSEESLSPNSNGARSPAQSPIPIAQSGTLHARSASYGRTQRTLSPQSPEVSTDAKHIYSQKEEKKEESRSMPNKEEGRRSYDRREERADTRKLIDVRKEEKGPVKTVPQRREEVVVDDNNEEAGSALGTAKANLSKIEKRALEELRNKVANAEAKVLEANQMAQEQARQFNLQMERLEGELRETGAMEVALYCVVAEHGNSSHKLHTPARRLARLYMHACKQWSPERRAGTAKNCVAGLVTVAKACGTDVSRLSFWWSNVVALRAVIAQAYDTGPPGASEVGSTDPTSTVVGNGNLSATSARPNPPKKSFSRQDSKLLSPKPLSSDWQQAGTFITALEKIEGWIYTKIIESLWWQAMIPRMQKGVDPSAPTSPRGISILSPTALSEFTNKAKEDLNKLAGDMTGIFAKKNSSVSLPELGDARQGNMSVEIWKRAMKDALCRLCPVRGAGHECGCLPMLIKTAIEGCCARLDVALFNAILRNEGDDVPTDPISDPVSDPSVLPISPGGLTFGGGSQLKNVVVTWSTFIHGLVTLKEPSFAPEPENGDSAADALDDPEKLPKLFNLIKATGDLLMLPKDFLMDRAFRKEICPMLSLQLIRRILVNFVPDEFAPDPITPSLLAALNAEAAIENRRHGEADELSVAMAIAPSTVYPVPSAFYVWTWIGEASPNAASWGRSSNSLLRKGYTSDEDLDVLEQLQESSASTKLDTLLGSSRASNVSTPNGDHSDGFAKGRQSFGEEIGASRRFQLLKQVWGTQ